MLVFVLFLVHNVACVSVLSIIDCNEEWMLVFVLCLVHNVACVSVLSINDCNEEWICVRGIDFTGFIVFVSYCLNKR
jgi:hypothetical protein